MPSAPPPPTLYDVSRLPHDPGERQPITSYHANSGGPTGGPGGPWHTLSQAHQGPHPYSRKSKASRKSKVVCLFQLLLSDPSGFSCHNGTAFRLPICSGVAPWRLEIGELAAGTAWLSTRPPRRQTAVAGLLEPGDATPPTAPRRHRDRRWSVGRPGFLASCRVGELLPAASGDWYFGTSCCLLV
jgi:hypothetical protein